MKKAAENRARKALINAKWLAQEKSLNDGMNVTEPDRSRGDHQSLDAAQPLIG
jgi:hypothetical protein